MNTLNDNFKIAAKCKILVLKIYNLMENIQRKDFFLKDKINNICLSLLETIYLANNSLDNVIIYLKQIKTYISLLDFLLEILYKKKYISLKQLEEQISLLVEINKMTTKWIQYKVKNES